MIVTVMLPMKDGAMSFVMVPLEQALAHWHDLGYVNA